MSVGSVYKELKYNKKFHLSKLGYSKTSPTPLLSTIKRMI